jgi:Putative beta-barrel porin-2, OmpL-like. bbp2
MKTKHIQTKCCHRIFSLSAVGLLLLPGLAFADSATNAPKTTLGGTPIGNKTNENFFLRLDEANRTDLGTPAFTAPAPVPAGQASPPQANRRGNPTPFDSPPYPTGEWQIGGTEIIGDPNVTTDYPLMEALYAGPHGDWWADSRLKFYGWEDFSGNLSTSAKSGVNPLTGQAANFPETYDQRPNRLEQNQFVLYAERTPDENQTDHADWGFRFSQVYGSDYRYMISRGWGSDQLLAHNRFDGFDNPMMYANLYIPKVADGLNLTLGRIISEADIEAQLAPNNLMSSHSLLYAFDPYCQWGLFASLKLNKNWVIQGGISAGNDVTPWETQDPGCQPTGAIMVQYQSDNNKFSFYGGVNAFNNAQWGFNNLQQWVGTLTYKFNDYIWTSHETWYMYQENCPGQTGGPGSRYGSPVPVLASDEPLGQNGGLGYTDGQIPVHPGYADEWATLNYTMFRLAPSLFFTIRNEVFDDNDGNRTGYATLYSEHSVGFTWWPSKLITVRPELRFDHSYGTHGSAIDPVNEDRPFDNGTKSSQFTAQMDVIYHF